MLAVIDIAFSLVSALALIPSATLLLEVLCGTTHRHRKSAEVLPRPTLAVLVPAHDEASGIRETIQNIILQLGPKDRLVVVADNCTDATAQIARDAGAEVIIRDDSTRRGKGFALDFGVRHLNDDPPGVLVIVDADCKLLAGSLDQLVRSCNARARPIQALYLMSAQEGSGGVTIRIAEFAWVIKNYARPMGLRRLGLPCQLMGTGMAFPWSCISRVSLATCHIAEDMKLGVELARAGMSPLFEPEAVVLSQFPVSNEAIRVQRTRWEHGHLTTIVADAMSLLKTAICTADLSATAMALDLLVPPLALLALLLFILVGTDVLVYAIFSLSTPLLLAVLACLLLLLAVAVSWYRYGRTIIPLWMLALAPVYALRKVPLYARFVISRQITWIRSGRDD